MKKKFKICIASRYMYDEYREYEIYYMQAKNIDNAWSYARKVVSHWNKKNNCIKYEVFDVTEVA